MCDICGHVLDLCGINTPFPWRTAIVAGGDDHNDSVLEDLCKTLSELELRAYLGGVSSGSDHVITTDDINDDGKELELLLSPSKIVGNSKSVLNKTATQSLKHNRIQNSHHLSDTLNDANTIATINKIKVCNYAYTYVRTYIL